MQLKKAKPSQHHLSQFAQKQMSPCHVHHPKLETTVDERIAAFEKHILENDKTEKGKIHEAKWVKKINSVHEIHCLFVTI